MNTIGMKITLQITLASCTLLASLPVFAMTSNEEMRYGANPAPIASPANQEPLANQPTVAPREATGGHFGDDVLGAYPEEMVQEKTWAEKSAKERSSLPERPIPNKPVTDKAIVETTTSSTTEYPVAVSARVNIEPTR